MAVFSTLCTTAFAGVVLVSVKNLGKHSWDIPLGFIASAGAQKSMVAQHALNGATLFLGKLCLLTMYHRVFGHMQKVRYQLIVTAVLALPLLAATIIRPVMVGPPVGKPWGTRNPAMKGADIPGLMIGIDNIVVDACLAWIPVPVIWGLKLEGGRKKGVMALFGTGLM
ncbi:unnamed protein product [Periconia digitata]|uniref:Rhodopsin domain-containing protein n=1 Tax=Periconia digitata TaxID=1303443 RepID=A0A9W4UBK1_9PLEO|nr:unnamed protein product [Periconia digitata]